MARLEDEDWGEEAPYIGSCHQLTTHAYRRTQRRPIGFDLSGKGNTMDAMTRAVHEELPMLAEAAPTTDLARVLGIAGRDAVGAAFKAASASSPYKDPGLAMASLDGGMVELWRHVATAPRKRNLIEMRAEAVQVAAAALRLIADICDSGRGRN